MVRKSLLWLCLGTAAAAAAVNWLPGPSMSAAAGPVPSAQAAKAEARPEHAPEMRWAALPPREGLGQPAGELFLPQAWMVEQPGQAAAGAQAPPAKAAAPAMPYRIVGKFVQDDAAHILLAKGDELFSVRQGDSLDEGYRVVAIKPDHVTLLYVPLGIREELPLASTFIIDEPR